MATHVFARSLHPSSKVREAKNLCHEAVGQEKGKEKRVEACALQKTMLGMLFSRMCDVCVKILETSVGNKQRFTEGKDGFGFPGQHIQS